MMTSAHDLEQEAKTLTNYLTGTIPSAHVSQLYSTALQANTPTDISTGEQKAMRFAFRHPRFLGAIDGALALTNPNAELRRRIYYMFAILETTPEHAEIFLSRRANYPIALIGATIIALRAVLRIITGLVILAALERT